MKNRLTTLDIAYLIEDIRRKLVGLRVDQIYDVDKKTYLIRFSKSGTKVVLLLESGTRFHTTSFEWPKNPGMLLFACIILCPLSIYVKTCNLCRF